MASVQQFDNLAAEPSFVFAVFFRGHWCPFCMAYLKDFEAILPEIQRANGVTVAITAEPEKYLPETLSKTGYSGPVVLDPELELVESLRRRGVVDVAVTSKSGYARGMIQPGVLVLRKDGEVDYSWAIKPSMVNLGGAKDRVVLKEVWEDVEAIMKGKASGPRQQYSRTGMLSGLKQQIFG